ncbi:3791_t:CDS:2 [Diversispora eburnea]|uniref:3791_t:CDS:1 n=1 Tax=Diversispora eburnea TaxID=1213867 RepID=A0A9N9CC36_9GLOM|nr:3791_t:CDS:2 [Diversispora eburnea]
MTSLEIEVSNASNKRIQDNINYFDIQSLQPNDDNINNNNTDINVSKEIPEIVKLIKDLKNKIKEIKEQISDTVKKASDHQLKINDGVSLLDIKYQTLLQYITNLCFVIHLKLSGKSIIGHPVITNLVELRIVLEKIKPVEQKLKYQTDKLIRAATMENHNEENKFNDNMTTNSMTDPLSFKPNPQNLVSDFYENNVKENDVKKPGIYKAPKLAPVHFDEGGSRSKEEKEKSRNLARASKSRIMKDLMIEYDDRPEEVDIIGANEATIIDEKLEKNFAKRNQFEEENFIRLPILATIQNDVEEEESSNVLARRNARKENYRRNSDDDDKRASASKLGNENLRSRNNKELFNGLISNSSQNKKRKTKFQTAKKNMKKHKRK